MRFCGRFLLLALLTFGLGGALACGSGRGAPLQRSSTVTAQLMGASDQETETAIQLALVKHHWQIQEKVPGRMTAELSEHTYRVKIQVVYGPPGIVINYVDSDGLRYAQDASGQETIHRKYATWIRNLSLDIQANLARRPPVGGAAPPAPGAAPPVTPT